MDLLLALLAVATGLTLVGFGVFWIGFQTVPAGYPDLDLPASASPKLGPGGLSEDPHSPADPPPPALAGFFRSALGLEEGVSGLSAISTAVIWGRGRYRFYGFMVPMRFRGFYRTDGTFLRTTEVTWFGRAVLRIREELAQDGASRNFEGWTRAEESHGAVERSLKQAFWRESFWIPTVAASASWQQVSESRFRCAEGNFEAVLNHKTGRPSRLEATTPSPGSGRRPWKASLGAWKKFHGIEIPTQVWIRHRRSQETDTIFVVQGVAYNLELPADLRQAHRHLPVKPVERPS